jgi:hypothetical protein
MRAEDRELSSLLVAFACSTLPLGDDFASCRADPRASANDVQPSLSVDVAVR